MSCMEKVLLFVEWLSGHLVLCKEFCDEHFNKAIKVTLALKLLISVSVNSLPGCLQPPSWRPCGRWTTFRSLSRRCFFIHTVDPGEGETPLACSFRESHACPTHREKFLVLFSALCCEIWDSVYVLAAWAGTNSPFYTIRAAKFPCLHLLFGIQHAWFVILCPLFPVDLLGLWNQE